MAAATSVFDVSELVNMIFAPLSMEDAYCAGGISEVAAACVKNKWWVENRDSQMMKYTFEIYEDDWREEAEWRSMDTTPEEWGQARQAFQTAGQTYIQATLQAYRVKCSAAHRAAEDTAGQEAGNNGPPPQSPAKSASSAAGGPNASRIAPSMPPANPTNRPQTIKQAKAAYKARCQVSLSEKEKRQLDRAVELDRRAWRTREADKKKTEAAKKRAEKERQQKEELQKLQLGSQRRCDRFGYKSSQMHLGAFLNTRNGRFEDSTRNIRAVSEMLEDDSFEDDDLDDETLLDSVAHTNETSKQDIDIQQPLTTTEHAKPDSEPQNEAAIDQQPTCTSAPAMDDLDSFWEDLDSSTQIARDLAADTQQNAEAKITSKTSSFSSGDFDLTIEDMELLDPPIPPESKLEKDRKLMPPPPVPPLRPEPAEEFTMSQLESFVEDDLQLTQADPG